MIAIGTISGKRFIGSLSRGKSEVNLTSNLLKTAVRMRLDFPVRLSPATTIRTPVKRRELMELDEAFSMVTTLKSKCERKRVRE